MAHSLLPGQLLARGVCRHLVELGFATLTEFVPARGLRVDVMALAPDGKLLIVECKSSRADFESDAKWRGYLEWCDSYYWAVDASFPIEILPEDTGIMRADGFDAQICRPCPGRKLASARRTSLIRKIARTSMLRLQQHRDPPVAGRLMLPDIG